MTDAERLFEFLKGTCSTVAGACELLELEETDELLAELDDLGFCCEECDWWCETSEESVDKPGTCTDCSPDDDY